MSDVSNSFSAWETLPEDEPPLCIAVRRPVSPPRHYEAEERNRVLTMKYGKQQMMLIRKRMKIENWIDAEVAKLFNGNENNGVDIDVDALLDLDSVPAKRKFVFDNLQRSHCPASMDKITMFLDEMIDQLNTL